MPSTREIRRRIRSVKNLSQITRAMEMVSASKMRRAQRNVLATRPYADRFLDVMGELTARMGVARRKGTLMEVRPEIRSVAVIVSAAATGCDRASGIVVVRSRLGHSASRTARSLPVVPVHSQRAFEALRVVCRAWKA